MPGTPTHPPLSPTLQSLFDLRNNPHLMPVSQMEVGCPGARGAGSPPTQTQVGRTPHKPALPATQPRAPPATQPQP